MGLGRGLICLIVDTCGMVGEGVMEGVVGDVRD